MDEAIETANRMRAETDTYIQQWGGWANIRKSVKAKINRKIEATNKAVAEAKRLTTIAEQAEKKAREAEKRLTDPIRPPGETAETGSGKPAVQAE